MAISWKQKENEKIKISYALKNFQMHILHEIKNDGIERREKYEILETLVFQKFPELLEMKV